MYRIGALTLYLINDALAYVDPGGVYGLIPKVLWSRHSTPNADGLLAMHHHSLYFEADGRKILIDTGFGRKDNDKARAINNVSRPHGDVLDALARLGVTPAQIDLVIDTHLHSDH
ncbi:MAG: MBL fold metallo-hydrolase, partial [Armatimonadetes bacterium]|nr:MBL fold metallo-hydrolase [Anaerolineae bacterium]